MQVTPNFFRELLVAKVRMGGFLDQNFWLVIYTVLTIQDFALHLTFFFLIS